MKNFKELTSAIGRNLILRQYGDTYFIGELVSVRMMRDAYDCEYAVATFHNPFPTRMDIYPNKLADIDFLYKQNLDSVSVIDEQSYYLARIAGNAATKHGRRS